MDNETEATLHMGLRRDYGRKRGDPGVPPVYVALEHQRKS